MFRREKWGGNYRTYVWYNGAPHAKIADTSNFERGNLGFGFSLDQMLTEKYGIFGRYSWADPVLNNIEHHWSLGAQMTGYLWGRNHDVAAIAIGQSVPGKKYCDVNAFHNTETQLETYYSFKLNDHVTISPDMQIIWQPNGSLGADGASKDDSAIFVYGIRTQINM
ncbi:MAG: carbohydrate porin [Candidatus Omnitrophica bacterium]|nr:carbohydrate porin [Candidatus Omnitrophota bacterium]